MKRLIVNADDYGLTERINEAIIAGHQNGIITSASLFANFPAFESAVRLARSHPALGVGVHLNLTEGRPVTAALKGSSLVNSDGLFFGGPLSLARRILKIRNEEIEPEIRGQIERVLNSGVQVTHLDSHKHVHLLPGVFSLVIELAREYKIKSVRCPAESRMAFSGLARAIRARGLTLLKQFLLGRILSALASKRKREALRAGLACAERFYGFTHTGYLDEKSIEEILRNLPEGTSELMCHPGYADEFLMRTPTRLLGEREVELQALTSPIIRGLVGRLHIELISHAALAGQSTYARRPEATDPESAWAEEARGGRSE